MPEDLLGPYRRVLERPTAESFDNHVVALEGEEWLPAGVWGGVFLEAFLQESQTALGLTLASQSDLGAAISRLRGVQSLPHGRDILDACDAVRLARNNLVHARARLRSAAQMHAQTIAGHLEHILSLALPWFKDVRPRETPKPDELPKPIARVFVSTITPHTRIQENFLRDLRSLLARRGLDPVPLSTDEWDRRDPMRPVLEAVRACDACLCVGLERSHAYFLREREGGPKMREMTHGYFSSGWLNMEAGAAFALGKPVIVICQSHIMSDGIFDRDWNSSPPFVMMSDPITVEDPAVHRALERLHGLVDRGRAQPAS